MRGFSKLLCDVTRIWGLYQNPLAYYADKLGWRGGRDRIILCKLNNGLKFKVHAGNSDVNSISEIFLSDLYRRFFQEITLSSVVVDIGANIGIVSVGAAMRAPKGRVFAFEPNREIFSLLQENVRLNHYEETVHLSSLAIAGQRKRSRLYFVPEQWGGASLTRRSESAKEYEVECIGLNDILEETGVPQIDFLKIDVEGAEVEILEQTSRLAYDRIGTILLECHPPEVSIDHMQSILEKVGFCVERKRSGDFDALYASR